MSDGCEQVLFFFIVGGCILSAQVPSFLVIMKRDEQLPVGGPIVRFYDRLRLLVIAAWWSAFIFLKREREFFNALWWEVV